MNRASPGRMLKVPPYRFDLFPEPIATGSGIFFIPPSFDGGRRLANLYDDGPILYSRNMVRTIDTRFELVPTGTYWLSERYGFRPAWGRAGYVVRVPKLVVVEVGLVPESESIAVLFEAAVQAAPRDATVICFNNSLSRVGTILKWAPIAMLCPDANTGEVDFYIAPETWIGGDVCVVLVSNGHPFNNEAGGDGTFIPFFIIGNMVTQERALFARMMQRVNRFQGTILYEPNPPPPDNPQPDDPPPFYEQFPPGSVFSQVCSGFPWTMQGVGGNEFAGNNVPALKAAITSFFS